MLKIPCPWQPRPPGMVPLEWPLVFPRKQQEVLENAAMAVGQWEGAGATCDALGHRIGSFSLAPGPAGVPRQNCPLALLAAPFPVGSQGSPSPEDSWRCWKGSSKMNLWDNRRAGSALEPSPAGGTGWEWWCRGSWSSRSSERGGGSGFWSSCRGMGEPGTGCCWSTAKAGLFSPPKPLEIAKQGEIMQNILQKDPCP